MVFTQPQAWSDHDAYSNLYWTQQLALEKLCQSPSTSTSPSPPSSNRSPVAMEETIATTPQQLMQYVMPNVQTTLDTQQYVYAQLVQTPFGTVEYVPLVMSPPQQPTTPVLVNQPQVAQTYVTPSHQSLVTTSALSTTGSTESTSSDSEEEGTPISITLMLEVVWHGEFTKLFVQYQPHQWTLAPTFTQPTGKWRTFQDSAKVRFVCSQCAKGWTSMKGRVVFWYYLDLNSGIGNVMFKLFGQQCKTCKSGKYEHAMWYPEEVLKVVSNIYNRVGMVYYGFEKPPIRKERRNGKPATMHDKELCQACEMGVCREK